MLCTKTQKQTPPGKALNNCAVCGAIICFHCSTNSPKGLVCIDGDCRQKAFETETTLKPPTQAEICIAHLWDVLSDILQEPQSSQALNAKQREMVEKAIAECFYLSNRFPILLDINRIIQDQRKAMNEHSC
jgi:hypothetical protein